MPPKVDLKMAARTAIKVYCTDAEKHCLTFLANQLEVSVSALLLNSVKELPTTPVVSTEENAKKKTKQANDLAFIRVYCSAERKEQLLKLAKQYNISLSKFMLSAVTGVKLISEADYKTIKEITAAAGIVGKYTGMLKIHLNRYELKDYTQKQIMREFKLACEARKKLLELSQKMLADCSDS